MKKSVLTQVIIGVFCVSWSFTSVLAQQNNTQINYKVEKKNLYSLLKVVVLIKDSVEIQQKTEDYSGQNHKSSDLFLKSIQSQFYKSIQNNKNIKLYLIEPKYISDILNLIPSKDDREKASKIYYENTYYGAIKVDTKSNIKSFSREIGKSYRDVTIEISIPLIVIAPCEFYMDKLTFIYDEKSYKTDKIQLTIEK
ncbi:MAG: hypothetical protein ACOYOT_11625 [Bacteroidales bacterium]